MEKLLFSVSIQAPKNKVWSVLWQDESYRNWTSAFFEGSYAVSDWKEGDKILFLGPDGSGMVSRIAEKRPNEYMSFEHLGMVNKGIEDTTSEKVRSWAGAKENYKLEEKEGVTNLFIEMDAAEDYKDYFIKTWPKALEQVKILSENNQ